MCCYRQVCWQVTAIAPLETPAAACSDRGFVLCGYSKATREAETLAVGLANASWPRLASTGQCYLRCWHRHKAMSRVVSNCPVTQGRDAHQIVLGLSVRLCQSSRLLSVQVPPITTTLAELFQRLIPQQLAQASVDIAAHAVEAAAQVNGCAIGQPGVQGAGGLAQGILHIALRIAVAGIGEVEACEVAAVLPGA